MTSVTERCVGAIIGTIVADAAIAPLHWVYDTEKVNKILTETKAPEFLEKSYCPFYNISSGRNTCYGEQVSVLLKSICENKGVNIAGYKKDLYEKFGPKSDFEVDLGHPITKEDYPILGPWRHASLKTFIQKYEAEQDNTGAENDPQSDGFSKVAPLAALYAGNTTKLLETVEQIVRVTQEDAMAVKCSLAAARILEKCIMGKSIAESIQEVHGDLDDDDVKGYIQKSLDAKNQDHMAFVKENGSSCRVPGNFMNALHCLLQSNGNFRDTVLSTLPPGGCNCSRLCFIGACLGAAYGKDAIPNDWISKTTDGNETIHLAQIVADLRT